MNTYVEGYVSCMVYVSNFITLVIIIAAYFENERYQRQFSYFPENLMLSKKSNICNGAFCENIKRYLAINYFCKKSHQRCLTMSQIRF